LYRRKIETLQLALAFAYAVKHYLRGEDGIDYPDYQGILPTSFIRQDEAAYNALMTRHNAFHDGTLMGYSREPSLSVGPSGRASPESMVSRPDPTKRVRAKRSKQKLSEPTPNTPLLLGSHHAMDVESSLPLPLMYVVIPVKAEQSVLNLFSSRIAHQLSRLVFGFRKEGFLETVGPAGANSLSQLYAISS
jgi:putative membrane protein